jgi:HEAT repeat protein
MRAPSLPRSLIVVVALAAAGAAFAGEPHVKLTDPAVAIEERVKHAKALGKDKSPKAIDALLEGLDIRHDALHAAIVESLKQQKGDVVLVQRASDIKRAPAERVAALAGLRVLKPATAGPPVAALLTDKDESVREAAAHALCVFGTAAAEAKLVEALGKESSAKVRYFVVVALGELKTPAAKNAVAARAKVEKDFAVVDALAQAQAKQSRP